MKAFMTGEAAVIRGIFESGCRFAAFTAAVSGLSGAAGDYGDAIAVETALDPLSAVECALGASLAGGRAFAAVDGAELPAAENALKAASDRGVGAGVVIAVIQSGADKGVPALSNPLPVMEPHTPDECIKCAADAFALSEEKDAPVLLLLGAATASAKAEIETGERLERELPPYRKNAEKFVPTAIGREAFCPGCPHLGTFYVLSKLWLTVMGDTDCLTLGALAPVYAVDACFNSGSSIAVLRGFTAVRGASSLRSSAAIINADAFCRRAGGGLLTALKAGSGLTLLVTDTSSESDVREKSIEALCRELGIERVCSFDPLDIAGLEAALREELSSGETGVIIVRRTCAAFREKAAPLRVNTDRCVGCKSCVKPGCPAVSFGRNRASIDSSLCVGCTLCQKLCRMGAILSPREDGT